MIRKYYFTFLLLLMGCTSYNKVFPKWYGKVSNNKNQIIGYGNSKTLKQATELAINAISQKLGCYIDSTINIERVSLSNNGNSEDIESKIEIKSKTDLNNLKVIKREFINNKWFVAVSYDNRTLFLKIIDSINPKNQNFNNSYLIKTKLFKLLKEYFGFYPKADIYAKNGQYYISIDNQSFLISKQEFVELFINNYNQNITMQLKERVKNNKTYFISTKFKRFGFASLFVVSHTGSVVGLFKNIKSTDTPVTYPNKEKYDGLKAKIDSDATHSRDMIVALLCGQKENLGLFNQVSTELEKESFRFGQLIDLMDRCAFSTRIITIYK